MSEEEKNNLNSQPNTFANGGENSTIDFSKISIDDGKTKEENKSAINDGATAISRINKETVNDEKRSEINLTDLDLSEEEQIKEKKVELGDSGIHSHIRGTSYELNYRKMLVISFLAIVIFGSASIIIRLYDRYIYFSSQPIMPSQYVSYVQSYKDTQRFVDNKLNLSDYNKFASLSFLSDNGASNIDDILKTSKLNYIQKKDILQNGVIDVGNSVIENYEKLDNVKKDISKYGFFSKEMYDLLENEEYVTSIKKSLMALEMIKFSSAIKVFSYLDTFISSLASSLNLSSDIIQSKMQEISARGEKDILVYLNNCYLNPYEIDYDCNLIGDFDRYYDLISKDDTGFDKTFFKKLMNYIDLKLEQTNLPSFSITFQKFDPANKQISFAVDVNTFKEDEIALIQKGIVNPHIFIVTNLLNMLKQSLYIISENIDAKQLKIQEKIIKIGSTVFKVNNSNMSFILPIQETAKREITDFVDNNLNN